MKKVISTVLLSVLFLAGYSHAEPVITEDAIRDISAELEKAVKNGDIGPFKKYLYEGSKITVDLDPSPSAGEQEVSYNDYMMIMEMGLPLMQNADIHSEILSVEVDDARNQGWIREKNAVTVEMMGVRVRDVSISETTYGIVDGQIKVLEAKDTLLSSEAVE